jgi:hypothetical protein
MKHVAHVCDSGGIEAQPLVESSCSLRNPRGASDRGKRVAQGDGTEGRASQQRTRCVCACGLAWEWGQKAQAAAHNEHVAHARDAGGIEAQRLVESSRSLPGSKGSSATHGNARHAKMWHRGREESAAHTRGACGPARECGHNAQAEAHPEHVAHVCDAGGLEAQRLVESIRILPSSTGYPTEGTRGTEEMAHGG